MTTTTNRASESIDWQSLVPNIGRRFRVKGASRPRYGTIVNVDGYGIYTAVFAGRRQSEIYPRFVEFVD